MQKDLDQRIQQGATQYAQLKKMSPNLYQADIEKLFFSSYDDGFKNPNTELLEQKKRTITRYHTVIPQSAYDHLSPEKRALQTAFVIPDAEFRELSKALRDMGKDINTGFAATISMKKDPSDPSKVIGGSVQYDLPIGLIPFDVRVANESFVYTELARNGQDPIDLVPMAMHFRPAEVGFAAMKKVAEAIWAENPTVIIKIGKVTPEQTREMRELGRQALISKEEFDKASRSSDPANGGLSLKDANKATFFTQEREANGFSQCSTVFDCFNKDFALPPAPTPPANKPTSLRTLSMTPHASADMAKAATATVDTPTTNAAPDADTRLRPK
jgi:hypothetical protein